MANTFKSYLASATGTGAVTVRTVAAGTQTVAVGINLANILTTQITASAYITRGSTDYYIVKDAPIPAQGALSVLDGKIILEAADVVKVICNTASGLDTMLSVLEIT
jgi:hypothetical protein|tara:strand:+ start:1118 stop:1438 length:321 start_codon:yes stop_codon:yes gene_type:complete